MLLRKVTVLKKFVAFGAYKKKLKFVYDVLNLNEINKINKM